MYVCVMHGVCVNMVFFRSCFLAQGQQSVEVSRKSTSSLPGLAAYSSSESSESADEDSGTGH